MGPVEEGAIIFITSTIVWPQVKQQGGNRAPPINRKLDWRFTDHGPAHLNRIQFPLLSFPSWSFRKTLILIRQRAGRLKTSITENKPNWSHGPQTCLTQWNYERAMLWRAIQDRQVMLEGSDKTWSTGEEKGKPLQYSCLKNPMNSVKRQKDRTLKDELPRWVGVQYATRDRWRNKSRKNEETEPKQKHLTMDVTGDGSQDQGCKEQYCIGTWNIRSMNQGKFEAVKQKMARVNMDILGISELKWTVL